MEEQKTSKRPWGPIFAYTFVGAIVIGVIAGLLDYDVVAGICGAIVALIALIVFGIAAINMLINK